MKADPRIKNKVFNAESPTIYMLEYVEHLSATLQHLAKEPMSQAAELLEATMKGNKRIYVCGNGGSAAIADHLCCDWTKGTRMPHLPTMKTHSLVANGALMTALANDFGYEETFATQVDMYGEPGDVLVAISSSGNSPNIVKAVKMAQSKGMKVLGLSGFSGGELAKHADISLHADYQNYGLVEDAHQIMMHVLSQYLLRRLEAQS